MAQYEFEDNYLALAVSILGNCIPEMAFKKLAEGPKGAKRNVLTDDDTEDMVKLKQELSYRKIGEIYCLTESAIFRRVQSYLENKKLCS